MHKRPVELTCLETIEPDGKQPLGKGFRPAFDALWHLKALGVVDDLKDCKGAWTDPKQGTEVRVAVIDTPVAYEHPNLVGAIDLALMRDFSIHDDGVFVVPTDDGVRAEREELLLGLSAWEGSESAKIAIKREIDGTDDRPYCRPRTFGAHGTAIAGLIGARPAVATLRRPEHMGENPKPSKGEDVALPYAGVNPFCQIVPITTSASPDPEMVLAALEYAQLIKPDIVVIAAAWEDKRHRKARWKEVDAALMALCKESVVLCAAGNSGDVELVYPACLSVEKDGPIAVTACDAKGNPLVYAPDKKAKGRVLRVISSSAEAYSDKGVIYDPWEAVDPMIVQPGDDPVMKDNVTPLPPEALISLDVPGPYGYNPSPYRYRPTGDGPHFDIGSLYCHFSGTSASTALAAGLIGLAIQERRQSGQNPQKKPGTLKPSTTLLTYSEAKSLYS